MLTATNIQFRGPFGEDFWERWEEQYTHPIKGHLKVVGKGITPFAACLRACAEIKNLYLPGYHHVDFVADVMDTMMDRCPAPYQCYSRDMSQRFYVVITIAHVLETPEVPAPQDDLVLGRPS